MRFQFKLPAARMLVASLALLASLGAQGAALELSSGDARTPLVELYTSEGCSSCPPADRWVGRLVDDEGLWTDFVPVAFHVTYWNYLGWRDAYSDPAFDLRQRRTARRAGSGVYTPGVFRNGDEWRTWRRGAGPAAGDAPAPCRIEATIEGKDVHVSFTARPDVQLGPTLIAHVAWLSGASTDVRRGENRGRLLRHEFTVRQLDQVRLFERDGRHVARVMLDAPQLQDSPAVAIWVEDRQGNILQSTGGWLPADRLATSGIVAF